MDDKTLEPVLDMIGKVLSPIGEAAAAQALEWVRKEIKHRALLTYCSAVVPNEAGGNGIMEWSIGGNDPMAGAGDERTIFALLSCDAMRTIWVFGYRAEEVDGGANISYWRDVVYNPLTACGPVSPSALFNELQDFFTGVSNDENDNDGGAPRQLNGGA